MPIKETHIFRVDPKTKRRVLAERNPKLEIQVEGKGRVIIQNGDIMIPDGTPIGSDIPDWLHEQLALIPDHVLNDLGIKREEKLAEASKEQSKPKQRGRPKQASEAVEPAGSVPTPKSE